MFLFFFNSTLGSSIFAFSHFYFFLLLDKFFSFERVLCAIFDTRIGALVVLLHGFFDFFKDCCLMLRLFVRDPGWLPSVLFDFSFLEAEFVKTLLGAEELLDEEVDEVAWGVLLEVAPARTFGKKGAQLVADGRLGEVGPGGLAVSPDWQVRRG